MQAWYIEDGTLVVSGTTRPEPFTRIWAGIGWPDREPGHFGVVGERLDGSYHALWEKRGGLWELGDAALEVKDRLLVECIWVDGRDSIATSYLRTLNGLCFREEPQLGSSVPLRALGNVAPQSRARPSDSTVTVVPVAQRVLENYRSALEKTRGMIMQGRLLVHERNCPRLMYTLRQPLEELLRSPVMRGLVWVISALEDTRGNGILDASDGPDPWYRNLSRGSD